jgi:hypothetical protein
MPFIGEYGGDFITAYITADGEIKMLKPRITHLNPFSPL